MEFSCLTVLVAAPLGSFCRGDLVPLTGVLFTLGWNIYCVYFFGGKKEEDY